MRDVSITEFRQQASRILDAKKPTAILRNSKLEGYYFPTLAFDATSPHGTRRRASDTGPATLQQQLLAAITPHRQ